MNASRAARVALPPLLLLVVAACPPAIRCHAADTGATSAETAREQQPATRRSHIQPVGEMAAAGRNADTLGLRLSRASEVLRQQLALARGAGLVVEEVIEGSVADKAGFKRYDVLVLLDDQMLLLPEQLAALLEASDSGTAPECTLLRGGVKVTIPLAQPGQVTQPRMTRRASAGTQPVSGAFPTSAAEPPAAVRQMAAKPATQSRLRPAASTLSLVQPRPAAAPAKAPAAAGSADAETLVRQDSDCQLRISRGAETRLVVTDLKGRVLFDREIDSSESRGLIPEAVLERVEEMERALESPTRPAVEVGRLEVAPIEIR